MIIEWVSNEIKIDCWNKQWLCFLISEQIECSNPVLYLINAPLWQIRPFVARMEYQRDDVHHISLNSSRKTKRCLTITRRLVSFSIYWQIKKRTANWKITSEEGTNIKDNRGMKTIVLGMKSKDWPEYPQQEIIIVEKNKQWRGALIRSNRMFIEFVQ